jgi:hypothetical protein
MTKHWKNAKSMGTLPNFGLVVYHIFFKPGGRIRALQRVISIQWVGRPSGRLRPVAGQQDGMKSSVFNTL